MRTTVLGAFVGAIALCTAPVSADPPNDTTYAGACALTVVNDGTGTLTTGADLLGILSAHVVAHAPTVAHNPVRIDSAVCEVSVNGSVVAAVPLAPVGPAAALAPTPIQVSRASKSDVGELCTIVATTDAHGQSGSSRHCVTLSTVESPPHEVAGLLDSAEEQYVDPTACPILGSLGPVVVRDLVEVDEKGDVKVAGVTVRDCPPYRP